jgi:Fe-S cluster assembly protein SufD
LLYIPKNVVLDDPIEVKLIQDSTKKLNWYQHLLIVADSNSSCRFLQHLTTVGEESNIANMMVEIIAKPGSHVEFSSVEELSKKTTFTLIVMPRLKKNAHVEWAVGLMNSCDTLGEIDSELIGEGSYANSQLVFSY